METQIICFIDKNKFMSLLNPQFAEGTMQFNDNEQNQLGYIYEDGKIVLCDFENEKAKNATVILVSDYFEFETMQYKPTKKILFLVHTKTESKRWSWIKTDYENLFIGKVREQETKNSSYGKIANWIKNNWGKEECDTKSLKQLIDDLLKTQHHEIEVVLDFLHECLLNQEISENTDKLKDKEFNMEFLEGKTIKDLPAVRDELFRQLEEQKNKVKCE